MRTTTVAPGAAGCAAPAAAPLRYFAGLDGLRCVAFLLIFAHHANQKFPVGVPWIERVLLNAWCGVDLFFVLSGFLVTHLLFEEARDDAVAGGPGRFSLWRFWARRSLRIWPLYFLALLLFLHVLPRIDLPRGVVPAAGTPDHDAVVSIWGGWSWSFTLNWQVLLRHRFPNWGLFDTLGPLWSVSMEEQFYVLWPLLLRFAPARHRLRLVLGIALLATLAKVPVAVWCWSYLAIYQNTFLRMDSFMCGALLAWAADRAGGAVPAPPRWTGWAVAAGAVVLAALPQVSRRDVPTTLAGYVLLDAVAAGAVWMCLTPSSTLHRLLRREPFRWLGSISYGLYVYHALALAIVLAALGPGVQATLSWPARAAAAASALAIAVALATLSYYAYERWFLRLKTLFSPRRPAAGAATPPLA